MWKSLVEELKERQDRFVRLARQLDETQREQPGVCGSWSPKQLIAHLSGWDREVLRQYKLFEEGMAEAIEHNIDEFNKESLDKRKKFDWEETLAELREGHRRFYQKALAISDEERSENEEYKNWIEVQIVHYIHHTSQLEEWL